jgi:hypothetical protein
MADLTVPVPDERIPEFYTFFGLWLSNTLSLPAATSAGSAGALESSPPAEYREWGDTNEDLADAVALWRKFSLNARKMFGLLIDNPGRKYTGGQIADECGIPNGAHGVAGVLAWPGRHGAAIGRGLPSHWREDPETFESFYWMSDERAALFAAAREQVEGAA